MKLCEKQSDFMYMVDELLRYVQPLQECYGVIVKWTEMNRTLETQKAYVNEGMSQTLDSKHLINLAVDFAVIKDGKVFYECEILDDMGFYWESIGGTWGGNWEHFIDRPHFEYNEKSRKAYVES